MNKAQSARIATESGRFKGFEPYKPYPCAMLFRTIYTTGISSTQRHHRDRLLGCQQHSKPNPLKHRGILSPQYDRQPLGNYDRVAFYKPMLLVKNRNGLGSYSSPENV